MCLLVSHLEESTNNIYFTDVNSDGLIDFVKDGVVYYNNLENGKPNFIEPQCTTLIVGGCDTIYLENGIDPTVFEESDLDTMNIVIPKTDLVRAWVVPYLKEDSIKVGCVFKQKNDPAYNGKKIKFSIEKDNQFLVLDSFNLYGSGEYYKETNILNNIEKGDKIFSAFLMMERNSKNIDWKCTMLIM